MLSAMKLQTPMGVNGRRRGLSSVPEVLGDLGAGLLSRGMLVSPALFAAMAALRTSLAAWEMGWWSLGHELPLLQLP